jgi:hypothetical protein
MQPFSKSAFTPILGSTDDMAVEAQELCFHFIMNGHTNAVVIARADGIPIPSSFNKAMATNEKQQWIAAMQAETNSLSSNGAFSKTHLPDGHRALKDLWVFALKTDAEGAIERFKARHVAKALSNARALNMLHMLQLGRQPSFRCILLLPPTTDVKSGAWVSPCFLRWQIG